MDAKYMYKAYQLISYDLIRIGSLTDLGDILTRKRYTYIDQMEDKRFRRNRRCYIEQDKSWSRTYFNRL